MAKVRGAITVDIETCKGCDVCVVACPEGILALSTAVNSKGYNYCYMVDPELCTGCANCGVVCPDSCITVYRVKI